MFSLRVYALNVACDLQEFTAMVYRTLASEMSHMFHRAAHIMAPVVLQSREHRGMARVFLTELAIGFAIAVVAWVMF